MGVSSLTRQDATRQNGITCRCAGSAAVQVWYNVTSAAYLCVALPEIQILWNYYPRTDRVFVIDL